MKIRIPSTALKDIGPLDSKLRLPMASRLRAGMKTTCDHCGKAITDEYFIGGFKAGHRNLKLHEHCANSDTEAA